MLVTTLVVVYNDEQVLLGMKKRGFGAGRWNGFGGKIDEGETIEQAALRELEEEVGIKTTNLEERGKLLFNFSDGSGSIEVHLFGLKDFNGEFFETEEMRPQWFAHDAVPYDEMWADDRHWLPQFLKGSNIQGEVNFDSGKSQNILSKSIREYEKTV